MDKSKELLKWFPLVNQQATLFMESAYLYYPAHMLTAIKRVVSRDDLVQECCKAFLEHIDSYDPERGALSTFLCAIFQNQMIDYFQKACTPLRVPTPSHARRLKNPHNVTKYIHALRVYSLPNDYAGMYVIPGDEDRDPTERFINQEQAEYATTILKKHMQKEHLTLLQQRLGGMTFTAIDALNKSGQGCSRKRFIRYLKQAKQILAREGFR